MGAASKVCSAILRFAELASAAIVVGILGRFLSILADANVDAGSRLIYSEVIGGISLVFSLLFFFPSRFSFYCCPLDFALFVCWIVAFALLCNLTGTAGCDSFWYWNYWGYYWGGFWRSVPVGAITRPVVGSTGCAQWRTILGFSFIGAWCWLLSAILGVYVCTKPRDDRSTDSERGITSMSTKFSKLGRKPKPAPTAIPTKEAEAGNFPAANPA